MGIFLLKTEPGDYSYADLVRDKHCVWSGVKNPQALIHLRTMRKGDQAFIYHTGDERAVVGLAKIVRDAYEDPTHPGMNDRNEPKNAVIDLAPFRAAKSPVTLNVIKADSHFKDFGLVRQSRLSVMPVPAELADRLRSLAGL